MNLCVFAGSSFGARPEYRRAAADLGATLASRRIGLVYGGARVGLMGAVADGALDEGGTVIGVIPRSLAELEIAHTGLTELHVVESMHARKARMADLADGFIVLPGGIGSLEEAFEVWTWSQLGIHSKPIGLLNVAGYYERLEGFLDHVVTEGFVKAVHRHMLLSRTTPGALIDALETAEVPIERKWVEP